MKFTMKTDELRLKMVGSKKDIAHICKIFAYGIKENVETENVIKIKKINAHTIKIGGQEISLDDKSIDKVDGTDYCIYKVEDKYIVTDNENLKNADKIGGFHYGLIPENFEAINNISKKDAVKIAGINAHSIWTKNHRPVCEPKGMAYVKKLNIWIDIYLCNSEFEEHGTSKAGLNILAGDNHNGRKVPNGKENFGYADFKEVAEKFGKRMIGEKEFRKAMFGVKEEDSAGSLDNGEIKHIPNFTSRYGIEQATGVQWIWSKDNYEDYDDRAVLLGGSRGLGVNAGSRTSYWHNYVWYSDWHIGCRFACDHMKHDNMSESEFLKGNK